MTDQQRNAVDDPERIEPEPAPAYAGDDSANDGYENPASAIGAAPVPTPVFPDQVEQVQGAAQGGDTGEGGATQPAPGGDEGEFNVNEANGDALNAELERRNAERADDDKIVVTGTGKEGNVLVEDVRNALKADDEKQAAA